MLRNYLLSHIELEGLEESRGEPRGTEVGGTVGWDSRDSDTEAQRNNNTLKRGVAKVLKKQFT